MSNQDLINQVEADKVRLNGLITEKNEAIDYANESIDNYTNAITSLQESIVNYENQILDLETAINNDDLIIALIPPDIAKK